MGFKKAEKKQLKARVLFEGASGSGKTYSALEMAKGLSKTGKIALIDTEQGSASLYADLFDFDTLTINAPYTPEKYIEAINEAEKAGYEILIIDSITHEWNGEGGCLDIQSKLGGRFQDWKKVTPRHNNFINKILQSKLHVLATARAKSDYQMSNSGERNKVEKVGLKTEQRDGLDFEFTVVFRLNENNMASVTKTRMKEFKTFDRVITEKDGVALLTWLNAGKKDTTSKDDDKAECDKIINRIEAAKKKFIELKKEDIFNDIISDLKLDKLKLKELNDLFKVILSEFQKISK